jgi:hypothetical protein
MRRRLTLRRALVILSFTSVFPLMAVACKKPPPAVVDAGPPPVEVDAAPAVLTALDEDAGEDAADAHDGAPAKHAGSGLNTNQLRAKQCCAALRSQAKTLGASPEANMLIGFAATCDTLAVQVGPTAGGQAPEFAPLRQMLKGHNIPAVCQGL